MILRSFLFLSQVFFLASVSSSLTAGQWYVAPRPLGSDLNPGTEGKPFEAIQKAVDTAGATDTVIVAQGTYSENIELNGKNIIHRSTDPADPAVVADTVIDGGAAGAMVTFLGTEDETCVLLGFTIRNGIGKEFPEQTFFFRAGGGICGGNVDEHSRVRWSPSAYTFYWRCLRLMALILRSPRVRCRTLVNREHCLARKRRRRFPHTQLLGKTL